MTEALQLVEVLQIKEDQEEEDDVDEIIQAAKEREKSEHAEDDESLAIRIKEVVSKMKKAAGITRKGDIPPTRNVESLRQMYVKSFISKVVTASRCRKCKGGWKKLQLYKSQIVYILKPGTALKSVG